MNKNNHIKQQRGAALIVSLILLVILTLLGVSMVKTNLLQFKIGGSRVWSAESLSEGENAVSQFINTNDGNFAPGFVPVLPVVDHVTFTATPELACVNNAIGFSLGSNMSTVYHDITATATHPLGGEAVIHAGVSAIFPGTCP